MIIYKCEGCKVPFGDTPCYLMIDGIEYISEPPNQCPFGYDRRVEWKTIEEVVKE